MCGINGILSRERDGALLRFMNDKIVHRGPDDDGQFFDQIGSTHVEMGMRRLSIIDLPSGNQPIISKDGNLVIVFNGEIYNYKSLKQELIRDFKVSFNTESDTEVILQMYQYYGVDSFAKLDGMFAFSILDKLKGKILIARDYFGEKPLYYYKTSDRFIWGSELKSLLITFNEKPPICSNALSLYFQLTYIPAPNTIYNGVFKLLPNHYLEVDVDTFDYTTNEISKHVVAQKANIDFRSAKKTVHDLVIESVHSRSVSDVPIGSFLSGGVDSSIVSLCLSKDRATAIDTFSIGFQNKRFDETSKSRLVAKQIRSNHHEFIVNSKSMEEDIDLVILNYDEPFADSSALPTYLVSKISRESVKVALTGDGGDEVFGGYNKYYIGKLNKSYIKYIPGSIHQLAYTSLRKIMSSKSDKRGKRYKLKRLLESVNYEGDFYKSIISLSFQDRELKSLLLEPKNSLANYFEDKEISSIRDFRNIDKDVSLEGDLLVKVDRASMLNSIECRAPFLNKNLWNLVNTFPDDFLIRGWDKKYILKQAFKDYFPHDFLDKSKQGFGVPVGDWLRTILSKELLSYIDINFLRRQNIFNIEFTVALVKNHLELKQDNTFRVWTFYCFQKWYTKIYLNE